MFGHEHDSAGRELFISEIYQAVLGAAPLSAALRALSRVTNADRAFWGSFDLQRRTGYFADSYNADSKLLERYNSSGAAANTWLAKSQYFQAPNLVWRGSRIVSMRDLVATAFYKDILEPQQIFHTLHIVVAVDGGRTTHVMLTRPRHEADFGEADIEIARCFAFHARKATENQHWVSGLRTIQLSLSRVIDETGLGVAIVDPPALLYASEAFEKTLEAIGSTAANRGGTFKLRSKTILFPRPLAEAINNHDNVTATPVVIERPDRDGRWLVVVRPYSVRNGAQPHGNRALVVTIVALDQPIVVDEMLLRRAYDLTVAEAHICSLLASGERVEQLSEKLQISANTTRTHLKRIFSKTRSRRQADLMRLLLSSAALARKSAAGNGTFGIKAALQNGQIPSRRGFG